MWGQHNVQPAGWSRRPSEEDQLGSDPGAGSRDARSHAEVTRENTFIQMLKIFS